jgi:hypothetical protein
VKQQLQQQWFALEGPSEAQGAIWQLLVHNSSSSSQLVKVPAKPAAAASADDGAEHQLLLLLRLQSSSSVQQLQRQVVLLQLMVDAQMAIASRQRLWSDTVRAGVGADRGLQPHAQDTDQTGCANVVLAVVKTCRLQATLLQHTV